MTTTGEEVVVKARDPEPRVEPPLPPTLGPVSVREKTIGEGVVLGGFCGPELPPEPPLGAPPGIVRVREITGEERVADKLPPDPPPPGTDRVVVCVR